jgi:hypothetical protein
VTRSSLPRMWEQGIPREGSLLHRPNIIHSSNQLRQNIYLSRLICFQITCNCGVLSKKKKKLPFTINESTIIFIVHYFESRWNYVGKILYYMVYSLPSNWLCLQIVSSE